MAEQTKTVGVEVVASYATRPSRRIDSLAGNVAAARAIEVAAVRDARLVLAPPGPPYALSAGAYLGAEVQGWYLAGQGLFDRVGRGRMSLYEGWDWDDGWDMPLMVTVAVPDPALVINPPPVDPDEARAERVERAVAMMAARLPQTDHMDPVAATLARQAVTKEGMGSVAAETFRETVYACAALDGYDTPQPVHVQEARGYLPRRHPDSQGPSLASRLDKLEARLDDLTVLVVQHITGGKLG